ncbi:hypothetical protein ACFWY5_30720 [Nonomuraea sp. NPDC059007]|uniref:hypothetical protein n=1 Tax=Nonomuraea sp. NPDC059007 TaxID=3346692 RepID=UPI0036B52384
MKRFVALTAAALGAALLSGTGSAQAAAPADPVTSLKKQFAPGYGVRVAETYRGTASGIKGEFASRTVGVIGFGRSSAADHDLTTTWKFTEEQLATLGASSKEVPGPFRVIEVGGTTYVKGFDWHPLPEGKHWFRFGKNTSWGNEGQRGDQLVDVFDPAVLKTLLAKAKVAKPGDYRGTLTLKDLYKASHGYGRPDTKAISFRLLLDRDRRPARLITEYTEKIDWPDGKGKTVKRIQHNVVDTRYSGWGSKVTVMAPPAEEVVDFNVFTPPVDLSPLDAVTDRAQAAVVSRD